MSVAIAARSLSRAEKVALIERVRAERPHLTGREKAALIGMAYKTYVNLVNDPDGAKQAARRERYKGVCEVCGAETKSDGTSSPSRRCGPCSKPEKVWTRAAVIAAIQAWAAEHGRPPTANDWLHADPDGRWPCKGSVYQSVDYSSSPSPTWADAIEAAGFPRPIWGAYERTDEWKQRMSDVTTRWTHEAVIAGIRAYVALTGEVPRAYGDHRGLLPTAGTVYKHGWSWPELVREAGFEPTRQRWTAEKVVDAIRRWNTAYGAPPKSEQWATPHGRGYPTTQTVIARFGRWNLAIEAAGFEPRHAHIYAARAAA